MGREDKAMLDSNQLLLYTAAIAIASNHVPESPASVVGRFGPRSARRQDG